MLSTLLHRCSPFLFSCPQHLLCPTRSMDLTWIALEEGTQGRERINSFISKSFISKRSKSGKVQKYLSTPPSYPPIHQMKGSLRSSVYNKLKQECPIIGFSTGASYHSAEQDNHPSKACKRGGMKARCWKTVVSHQSLHHTPEVSLQRPLPFTIQHKLLKISLKALSSKDLHTIN